MTRVNPTLSIISHTGVPIPCSGGVETISWAGSIKECARTLDFGLLSTCGPCELGAHVNLTHQGNRLFSGMVFERTRDAASDTFDLGCTDRGIYLKRNSAHYKFKKATPDAITRRLCTDFGISVGNLAAPGVAISRNFPGASLYSMIATAYNLVAQQTGQRYAIRFRGTVLDVVAKERSAATPILRTNDNLQHTTVTESVGTVNQVAIYNSNDVLVGTQRDADAIQRYGLFQSVLTQSKDKDAVKAAKKLLEDNGMGQSVTVTVYDEFNPSLISGNCVIMQEHITGLYGLFWIDSDTHIWTQDGEYTCKLTLNFRNIMDEQEAGSLPK